VKIIGLIGGEHSAAVHGRPDRSGFEVFGYILTVAKNAYCGHLICQHGLQAHMLTMAK
jgi:hypothetical protein